MEKNKLKPKKLKNVLWAFFTGGITALLGQAIVDLFVDVFKLPLDKSTIIMILIIILLTNILTAFGLFDKYAKLAGAGAFIPISGFANALTSAALEGKSEGPIYGIGANVFKLAGSVLVYGISSALIYGFVYQVLIWIGVIA